MAVISCRWHRVLQLAVDLPSNIRTMAGPIFSHPFPHLRSLLPLTTILWPGPRGEGSEERPAARVRVRLTTAATTTTTTTTTTTVRRPVVSPRHPLWSPARRSLWLWQMSRKRCPRTLPVGVDPRERVRGGSRGWLVGPIDGALFPRRWLVRSRRFLCCPPPTLQARLQRPRA